MRRSTFSLVVLLALQSMTGASIAIAAEPQAKKPATTRPNPRPQPKEPVSEDPSAAMKLPEAAREERALAKQPGDRAARMRAARAQLAAGADTPSRVESALRLCSRTIRVMLKRC
jgi:thioredoxin-like negative regulator of GroEL